MGLLRQTKVENKNFKILLKKFEEKKLSVVQEIKEKHKDFETWADKKGLNFEDIFSKGARGLATGAAAGAIVLTSGLRASVEPANNISASKDLEEESLLASLEAKKDVRGQVKKDIKESNFYNPDDVAKNLSKTLNITLKTRFDGVALNTNYGIMGYESHLTRYPGDNLATHFETDTEYKRFAHASMAGGPGAWGHIAPSKQLLSKRDIERERYYLVVQTFLSPNWGSPKVKQWFHHRKMVAVNPASGRVVVGAIEDAGPEPATGRNFGGSPEVMEALGFSGGGSYVFMFFVDDPEDKVPLGVYGL